MLVFLFSKYVSNKKPLIRDLGSIDYLPFWVKGPYFKPFFQEFVIFYNFKIVVYHTTYIGAEQHHNIPFPGWPRMTSVILGPIFLSTVLVASYFLSDNIKSGAIA